MLPTSFEDAIQDVQTTARNLKLPDALRAINELLVRSWGDEIAVEVPTKEAIYVTPRRPRLGGSVDAFGIHRFEYRADDEHPLSQERALALRYTRVERNPESGDDVRSFSERRRAFRGEVRKAGDGRNHRSETIVPIYHPAEGVRERLGESRRVPR